MLHLEEQQRVLVPGPCNSPPPLILYQNFSFLYIIISIIFVYSCIIHRSSILITWFIIILKYHLKLKKKTIYVTECKTILYVTPVLRYLNDNLNGFTREKKHLINIGTDKTMN